MITKEVEMRDFSKTIRVKNSMKGIDSVNLDVPLFIRLLEFAREDAKDDVDLHVITENINRILQGYEESGEQRSFLTMQDYDAIIEGMK